MQKRSRTGAVLTELIVVVLIFTLCAAVLIQLFTASVGLSRKAGAQSEALNAAGNAMELLCCGGSPEEALQKLGFTGENGAYTLVTEAYTLRAAYHEEPREKGTMLLYEVEAVRGEESLFTLSGKTYRGQEDA